MRISWFASVVILIIQVVVVQSNWDRNFSHPAFPSDNRASPKDHLLKRAGSELTPKDTADRLEAGGNVGVATSNQAITKRVDDESVFSGMMAYARKAPRLRKPPKLPPRLPKGNRVPKRVPQSKRPRKFAPGKKPPPRRPPPVKKRPRPNGRSGASKNKWKEKRGKAFDKKKKPAPNVPSKKGYGYDKRGQKRYYHDDFGGGEYVDMQTGRKRPGVLSYGSEAMSGVSGLVGGLTGKQNTETEYYDDKGNFDPPADDGNEESYGWLGLKKRSKNKEGGFNLVTLAALAGVPVLLLGSCGMYVLSKNKRRGRKGARYQSESESESSSEISVRRPSQQRKKKRWRIPKVLRRKRKRRRRPPPTSLVSCVTETEATQTAATEATSVAVETDLPTAPRRSPSKKGKRSKPAAESQMTATEATEAKTFEVESSKAKDSKKKKSPDESAMTTQATTAVESTAQKTSEKQSKKKVLSKAKKSASTAKKASKKRGRK